MNKAIEAARNLEAFFDVDSFYYDSFDEKEVKEASPVWVFLDEINTADCMGLFKEIICDRTMNGEPLPSNLVVLAACNPYRLRNSKFSKSSALAKPSEWKDEKDTLSRLVYRVYPLPESMKLYSWDFGTLSILDEQSYVRTLVTTRLSNIPIYPQLPSAIIYAHKFLRSFYDEISAVSLRDVIRCITIYRFFCSQKEVTPVQAAVLSVAHCYYYRLPRDQNEHKSFVKDISKELNCTEQYFEATINYFQKKYIEAMSIRAGVAQNQALKENVFMMLVCIMNKIPLIVVGKPGSSKTLAVSLIRDNFTKTTKSKDSIELGFKEVYMVPFQCTRLSTPEGIEHRFHDAIE